MNPLFGTTGIPTRLQNTWKHVKEEWLAVRVQKNNEELSREALAQALREAKYELDVAYINFDCAYNADLVKLCTYNLKAAQEHYNYLTKLTKEKNSLVS